VGERGRERLSGGAERGKRVVAELVGAAVGWGVLAEQGDEGEVSGDQVVDRGVSELMKQSGDEIPHQNRVVIIVGPRLWFDGR